MRRFVISVFSADNINFVVLSRVFDGMVEPKPTKLYWPGLHPLSTYYLHTQQIAILNNSFPTPPEEQCLDLLRQGKRFLTLST